MFRFEGFGVVTPWLSKNLLIEESSHLWCGQILLVKTKKKKMVGCSIGSPYVSKTHCLASPRASDARPLAWAQGTAILCCQLSLTNCSNSSWFECGEWGISDSQTIRTWIGHIKRGNIIKENRPTMIRKPALELNYLRLLLGWRISKKISVVIVHSRTRSHKMSKPYHCGHPNSLLPAETGR